MAKNRYPRYPSPDSKHTAMYGDLTEERLIQAYTNHVVYSMSLSKSKGMDLEEKIKLEKQTAEAKDVYELLKEYFVAQNKHQPDMGYIRRQASQRIIEKTGLTAAELASFLSRPDEMPPRFIPKTSDGGINVRQDPSLKPVAEVVPPKIEDYKPAVSTQSVDVSHVSQSVTRRLKEDFPFFCEQALKILFRPGLNKKFPEGGSGPLVPNEHQLRIIAPLIDLWIDRKPVRAIILKSRQMGVTTILLAFWMWLIIQKDNFVVMFIIDKDAHMFEKRDTLIKWAEAISEKFPDLPCIESRGAKVVRFSNGSKILFESSQSPNPGTSEQIHALHCSEKPKWVKGRDTQIDRSILPGISESANTFIVDESTADGINGFYKKWVRVMNRQEVGTATTLALFVAWCMSSEYRKTPPPSCYSGGGKNFLYMNMDRELSEIDENGDVVMDEEAYAKTYNLNDDQVYWRRIKIKNDFKGSREDFDKEYPTTPDHAWRSNGSLFFGSDVIIQAEKSIKEPVLVGHIVDGNGNNDPGRIYAHTQYNPSVRHDRTGTLRIYDYPVVGEKYFIGGDVAEGKTLESESGVDNDFTVFTVIDSSGKLVALYRARTKPEDAALPLILLGKLYNNAKINVERNSVGEAVWVMFKQSGYANIYTRDGNGPFEDRAWNKLTQSNRKTLLLQTRYILRQHPEFIVAKEFLEEVSSFVRTPDGRPEAMSGKHDDIVCSYTHAFHAIYEVTGVRVTTKEEEPAQTVDDTLEGLFEYNGITDWEDQLHV